MRKDRNIERLMLVHEAARTRGMRPGWSTDYQKSEFQIDTAIDGLIESHADMAMGFTTALQSAADLTPEEGPMPYEARTLLPVLDSRIVYLHGKKVRVGDNGRTQRVSDPEYVEKYRTVRERVLQGLIFSTAKTQEPSLLLSTIATLKDPVIADTFLAAYYRKNTKPSTAGMTRELGTSVLRTVQNHKEITEGLRAAVSKHAEREKQLELRRKNLNAGLIGGASVWLAAKTGVGVKGYAEQNILQPVVRVAQLPPVEQQALQGAYDGLNVADRLKLKSAF